MYLGYRQYQLHFDVAGSWILFASLIVLGFLVRQVRRGHVASSLTTAMVLLSVCMLQFYRGWMVSDSVWLTMLESLENSKSFERIRRIEELREYWNTDVETLRASDWYTLAGQWNVCHRLWRQANCPEPRPSEPAAGIAREMLNDLVTQHPRPSGAQ